MGTVRASCRMSTGRLCTMWLDTILDLYHIYGVGLEDFNCCCPTLSLPVDSCEVDLVIHTVSILQHVAPIRPS